MEAHESSGPPSGFMSFQRGVGHYDANRARDFFARFGQAETFKPDTTIFRQNEKSNSQSLFKKPLTKALTAPLGQTLFARTHLHRMYFLVSGELVLSGDGMLAEFVQIGDVFGEMAVLTELPDADTPAARTATASTKSQVEVYSLEGEQVLRGLKEQPEFALMLMSVMFDRLRFQIARLASRQEHAGHRANRMEPVFTPEVVAMLRERLGHNAVVHFHVDDRILREGAPGTTMYVVTQGEVAVAVGRRIVEKLSVGGVFGEMALVDQLPRAASAVARTECSLLAISRPQLMSLIEAEPSVGMVMMRAIAARLRYMNALLV
jgi:CRP/FNR family transcriptional regulator, cyclic AMP receptor protein